VTAAGAMSGGDGAARPTGVLVMAHGTPARPADIPAFYTAIRRGRPPSAEQLAELEGRYAAIGGTSPLNEVTRAQVAGIAGALETRAPCRYVVAGGAKFAAPLIEEAAAALVTAGVDHIIGLVLAPHSSVVSVGQYAERAEKAVAAAAGPGPAPAFTMIDHWYEAPGFVAEMATRVAAAVEALDGRAGPRGTTVVFTAHSVPTRVVVAGDSYPLQLEQSARAVAAAAGIRDWSVGWQSAGRTDEQWLGPDINVIIRAIAGAGGAGVVVCPIGFVADHLEVLYDVDIEARGTAVRSGLAFGRTASLNADPGFCAVLAEVVMAADGAGPGG
jgi:protoporphyrin/coproporphyrin ferrochelatase